MPSVSKKQRRLMGLASHHPEKVFSKNRGVLKMSDDEMRKFASTPEKHLPMRKGVKRMYGKRKGMKR